MSGSMLTGQQKEVCRRETAESRGEETEDVEKRSSEKFIGVMAVILEPMILQNWFMSFEWVAKSGNMNSYDSLTRSG